MKHYHLIVISLFAGVYLSTPAYGAPTPYESFLRDCKSLFDAGQYGQAFDIASQGLALSRLSDDEQAQLHYYMGASKRYLGEYSSAFRNYDKAISLATDPDEKGKILLNMGALLTILNQHDQAIEVYTRSINLSPKWSHTGYYNRALSFKEKGQLPEAVKDLFASLQVCEEKGYKYSVARVYNQLGLIEKGLGHHSEGRDYFFKAIGADVDSSFSGVAWHNIGLTYLIAGDTLNAISSLQQALTLHSNPDQLLVTYYDLCDTYIALHQEEVAGQYFDLAVDVLQAGATLDDMSIKLLFIGAQLGRTTPQEIRTAFDQYTSESDRTMEAFQTYAGALLLQQVVDAERLKRERLLKWIIGISLLVVTIGGFAWYQRKRRAVKQRIMFINQISRV